MRQPTALLLFNSVATKHNSQRPRIDSSIRYVNDDRMLVVLRMTKEQRYPLRETILVGGLAKHLHQHRPPLYDPEVQKALITIWSASTFLGPVRPAGGMPLFVENLTTHGHLHMEHETR